MDYQSLKELIAGRDCYQFPLSGTNTEGENVEVGTDKKGTVIFVDTHQKNGWTCKQTFYLDGTVSEEYEK